MNRQRLIYLIVGVIAAVGLGALMIAASIANSTRIANEPLPLINRFEDSPGGFTFRYPEGWVYVIPIPGTLIAAPPSTLNDRRPGPTFSVQRAAPLTVSGTLENALNGYLERGPLSDSDNWQITQAVAPATLDGREALSVALAGTDPVTDTPLITRITATTADNTFVYVVVTTVPADQSARYESTLIAMTDSVEIFE